MFRESSIVRRGVRFLSAMAIVSIAAHASAGTITGFGTPGNYGLIGYTQDNSGNIIDTSPPTISAGVLTLTTAAAGEARAAYFKTAQPIGSFTAQFTYRNDPASEGGLGAPDGFAFVLHNDSRGLNAIGGGGAGLGYGLQNVNQPPSGPPLTAIVNSASIQFYLRNGTGATEYKTGGAADFASSIPVGSVDLTSGDPILVSLSYNGTSLTETLTDLTTPANTFTTSYAANIPAAVGGTTALVGFTGGTGGAFANQTISNFSFTTVPEPGSLSLLGLGTLVLISRRRRAGRALRVD